MLDTLLLYDNQSLYHMYQRQVKVLLTMRITIAKGTATTEP